MLKNNLAKDEADWAAEEGSSWAAQFILPNEWWSPIRADGFVGVQAFRRSLALWARLFFAPLALERGVVVNYICAPVAQWIEQRPPEPCARVRIAPGVPKPLVKPVVYLAQLASKSAVFRSNIDILSRPQYNGIGEKNSAEPSK